MRATLPILLLLGSLTTLPALVDIKDQGAFVEIREVHGGDTQQLLFLKKRDISAVTYTKAGGGNGEVTLIMHYRDDFADQGGFVTYRIKVPPAKDGEHIAERIIGLIDEERGGHVIKREVAFPPSGTTP